MLDGEEIRDAAPSMIDGEDHAVDPMSVKVDRIVLTLSFLGVAVPSSIESRSPGRLAAYRRGCTCGWRRAGSFWLAPSCSLATRGRAAAQAPPLPRRRSGRAHQARRGVAQDHLDSQLAGATHRRIAGPPRTALRHRHADRAHGWNRGGVDPLGGPAPRRRPALARSLATHGRSPCRLSCAVCIHCRGCSLPAPTSRV